MKAPTSGITSVTPAQLLAFLAIVERLSWSTVIIYVMRGLDRFNKQISSILFTRSSIKWRRPHSHPRLSHLHPSPPIDFPFQITSSCRANNSKERSEERQEGHHHTPINPCIVKHVAWSYNFVDQCKSSGHIC